MAPKYSDPKYDSYDVVIVGGGVLMVEIFDPATGAWTSSGP